MTKKDFKAIAEIINQSPSLDDDQKMKLAQEFATWLRTTNPRFDRSRFISAATT